MRRTLILSSSLLPAICIAGQPPEPAPIPEPPELPRPVQDGEVLEPDITIIRKGKKTIQEFRKNGQLYMIRIKPAVGPAYYLIDTDGDGNMDVRQSDLDKESQINQWKLLEWK